MSKDVLLVNKIAGGVLAAGLIAMSLGSLSHMLYDTHELEQNAYTISEGGEVTTAAPVVAEVSVVMISDMLGAADVAKGVKVAKKCGSCHSFDEGGAQKTGPNLYDILGRDVASVDGFSYSSDMSDQGGVWGFEELSQFLTKPKKYIAGTKMTFAGLKKPADRANLIAYLRTLSANPVTLP